MYNIFDQCIQLSTLAIEVIDNNVYNIDNNIYNINIFDGQETSISLVFGSLLTVIAHMALLACCTFAGE